MTSAKASLPGPCSYVAFVPSSPAPANGIDRATCSLHTCTRARAWQAGRQIEGPGLHRRHGGMQVRRDTAKATAWLGLGLRWDAALPPKPYAP